ncbi:MAG: STAS domain-containing protein [Fuerstiella sp.]
MSGFAFEKHSEYCTLRFTPDILEMTWTDLESATERVARLVRDAEADCVLVDLSRIDRLPSGLVASLVRLWKQLNENRRKLAVVSPRPGVQKELRQDGLTSLWKMCNTEPEALKALGVHADSPIEVTPVPSPAQTSSSATPATTQSSSPHASSPQALVFEEQRRYCSITFYPVLMTMNWSDVEAATTDAIDRLKAAKTNSVMVDLGPLDMINSALVASLVRIWKTMQSSKGQFSLVSPNEMVTEVLKSAGLWKLWSVVDEREEAVYELGASEVALVETRERRLLMLVAVPCAIVAGLALIPMFMKQNNVMGVNAQLTALLLAAAGLTTGLISIVKDSGIRRLLSSIAVVISIAVLSTLWIKGSPITFGFGPPRDLENDTSDTTAIQNGRSGTVKPSTDSDAADSTEPPTDSATSDTEADGTSKQAAKDSDAADTINTGGDVDEPAAKEPRADAKSAGSDDR